MSRRNHVMFGLLLIALWGAPQALLAQDETDQARKAVLVTGASSGLGRHMAESMAADGYLVYASARKQADLDALNAIPNIHAIRLDVTKQEEIDAAVAEIREAGTGLYGLVNNAGIGVLGPMAEIPEEELAWIMDVNVMGVYRVTKAFAPLIIESKGRIVNISSISGILSGMFWAPYTMGKHAIEAYTVALAEEMSLFDVQVSAVNPGNFKSKIGTSEASVLAEKPYAQPGSPYAEHIAGHIEYLSDRSMYKEPDAVTEAVRHALFDPAPRPSYLVVPNQGEAERTVGRLLEKAAQFNAHQEFAFSEDELVAMLRKAIAGQ